MSNGKNESMKNVADSNSNIKKRHRVTSFLRLPKFSVKSSNQNDFSSLSEMFLMENVCEQLLSFFKIISAPILHCFSYFI